MNTEDTTFRIDSRSIVIPVGYVWKRIGSDMHLYSKDGATLACVRPDGQGWYYRPFSSRYNISKPTEDETIEAIQGLYAVSNHFGYHLSSITYSKDESVDTDSVLSDLYYDLKNIVSKLESIVPDI